MMTGENLADIQLQQVVDHTMILGDKDGDKRISFKEFATLVQMGTGASVHKKMVINGV
jgi:serine/threonine-protein phosphatase 2B regulatory subunit